MKIFLFLLLALYAIVTVDCAKCAGTKQGICAKLEACEKREDKLSDEVDKLDKQVKDLSNQKKELESDLSVCDDKVEELKKEIEGKKPGARNCKDLLAAGKTTSGVYSVNPDGQGAFDVYCDQTTNGGGYALIQRRKDGSVDFYRDWDDYVNGFGDFGGEFWLGLEKIHRLTNVGCENELRVGLIDWAGNSVQAVYEGFRVAGEKDLFRMDYHKFAGGTAGDSMAVHKGMVFSTRDRDHDKWALNCAVTYKGAWWYNVCHQSNLNGQYKEGGNHVSFADGINWVTWKGYHYSAKSSAMRIRPM